MSATTTVLLHGFTGDPSVWQRVASGLGGEVLTPLLPGHGPSPHALGTWDSEVERLTTRLDEEGVRGAHLVGYSLGGRLGWHLAARDDLFARATLIGAHPGLATDAERRARRRADLEWITRLLREGLDAFIAAWEALPLWESQRELPAETLARQRAVRRSHTAAGLAASLRVLGLAEMPPPPPPRIPVQLVVGARDHKHLALASSLGRPLALVSSAGHNVPLEAPEALTELLR